MRFLEPSVGALGSGDGAGDPNMSWPEEGLREAPLCCWEPGRFPAWQGVEREAAPPFRGSQGEEGREEGGENIWGEDGGWWRGDENPEGGGACGLRKTLSGCPEAACSRRWCLH